MPDGPPLTTKGRIYQDIANAISEQIRSGKLGDGHLLPSERALAANYGASRTTVREALLSLQTSGLISIRQKARARVTLAEPAAARASLLPELAQGLLSSPNGMSDLQDARVLFECGLARLAARHASVRDIERLRIALAANKRSLRDPDLFAQTDVAFHTVLAEIPRNPIFVALNSALSDWLMSQRTVGLRAPVRGAMQRAYRGHQQVFDAIAARDVERADRAMAAHLQVVSRFYWKSVETQTPATAVETPETAVEV
jgi:GntR family transcriptional repressor for pyruvate dehydrogenase complex